MMKMMTLLGGGGLAVDSWNRTCTCTSPKTYENIGVDPWNRTFRGTIFLYKLKIWNSMCKNRRRFVESYLYLYQYLYKS